ASNAITKLSIDENGRAKFEFVHGVNSSFSGTQAVNPSVFVIRNQTPERAGPTLAWFASQVEEAPHDVNYNRALFSLTGGADGWTSIARGEQIDVDAVVAVGPTSSWIYIQKPPKLVRFPLPASSTVLVRRPLLVGPGGRNLVWDSFYVQH